MPTTITLPSAGHSTSPSPCGTSRGGSRKNCRMKTVTIHSGSAHQPKKYVTTAETIAASARKGQPSRATMGCGQFVISRLAPRASCLVSRRVHELVLPDPRHHRPQPLAHLLDVVLGQ